LKSVALKAFAKINLGLAVIGRREDGYHELRTVYQSISLADDLQVALSPGASSVSLETSGIKVPEGRENLAVRSAEAVMRELKLKGKVSLLLRKRIPAGSGLGGASSDAAAVIRALMLLSGRSLASDRLLHLAASLGSDVPLFLLGGRALGVGRGEEVYSLPEEPRRSCVVVFPGTSVSTAEAYAHLRRPLLTTLRTNHNIELFCAKISERDGNRPANDFEPYAFSVLPQLAEVKRKLIRAGAEVASLSGSGSAVYGIFSDSRQAREAAQRVERPGYSVYVAHTVSRREFQTQVSGARRWA
jgi:4-diphosphocytidyl-2-C-methyl-D-erythritol kinase